MIPLQRRKCAIPSFKRLNVKVNALRNTSNTCLANLCGISRAHHHHKGLRTQCFIYIFSFNSAGVGLPDTQVVFLQPVEVKVLYMCCLGKCLFLSLPLSQSQLQSGKGQHFFLRLIIRYILIRLVAGEYEGVKSPLHAFYIFAEICREINLNDALSSVYSGFLKRPINLNSLMPLHFFHGCRSLFFPY